MPEQKLVDHIRDAIRRHGYSSCTEKAYVAWYERYVRSHQRRHPSTMSAAEVEQCRTPLAAEKQI